MATVDRDQDRPLRVGISGKLEELGPTAEFFSAPGDLKVQFVTPEPHDLIYRVKRAADAVFTVVVVSADRLRKKSLR